MNSPHPESGLAGSVEGAAGAGGQAISASQYVTFEAGDEVFAVAMAPVQEIIRVPDVVRVPLSPPTLDGLANLRGKVLPIVSLRRALGFADRAADDASRAVVIDLGQPIGFVVDRVASVVGVDASKIEDVGSISGTVNAELLSGLIKDIGGHAMVMVLNFEKLIAQEFAQIAAIGRRSSEGHSPGTASTVQALDTSPDDDELQLVSFDVAGQEYAITIEDVQEIVQVPEQIIQVPHAQAHVLGVMTLRNRLLPLVALRRMFVLAEQDANEQSRIVVLGIGGASVGVVVDKVNEVLRVARRDVQAMPSLLAQDESMSDVSEICRLEAGKRLVSIICTTKLFRHSVIKEALNAVNDDSQSTAEDHAHEHSGEDGRRADDDEQVVVFRLGSEEFGVPIDSVQEIVRVPDLLTHVPKAPASVEGVINLRGTVLPVLDLRRRLGLAAIARNDGQRIVVFLIRGVRTGFIVDAVAEVLKVPRRAIEAAPQLSDEQSTLLARMANLEKQKRMLQLIDPAYLLAAGDLQHVAELAA
ncbi:chemotaxis protein CheW [Paucibacter sp. DJ1R-11]|uniref:chemotaxis protein CheW n=1 Tax=Paucibacter sp. DJ1R-11 TaxID=2893556 RepID=UPI0021E3F949|nr:chemotaxis protein CheW [Paucibacter sp. DJ1R-11]MCV2361989.1 chemotaxis protein CheW [Paucibacter sp. DJ1R-11]